MSSQRLRISPLLRKLYIPGPDSNWPPHRQPCRQVNCTMDEVHVAIEPGAADADPGVGRSVCRTPLGVSD